MRRRSKSEILESKKRRQRALASTAPSADVPAAPDQGAGEAPASPMTPFRSILADFKAAVDDYHKRTPHLQAFSHLQPLEPEAAQLLSEEAQRLLEELREQDPNDHVALHHLAIIHHGKGFELHLKQRQDSPETIQHWRAGLNAWAELVNHSLFWEQLKQRWQERMNVIKRDMLIERLLRVDLDALRRQLPGHLLNLHKGFVTECFATEPEAARQHMELIVQSGFSDSQIEKTRRELYTQLTGGLNRFLKELKFDKARAAVVAYLKIDPDYPRALGDAARVCTAECQRLREVDEEKSYRERQRLFKRAVKYARHPALQAKAKTEKGIIEAEAIRGLYVAGALADTDQAACLDDDAYKARADAFEKAAEKAKLAIPYERGPGSARELFMKACGIVGNSDMNAGEDLRRARRFLDAALQVDSRDPFVAAVNARYYYEKEDEERFREELKKAEEYNQFAADGGGTSLLNQLKQFAKVGVVGRKIARLLNSAIKAYNADRYRSALEHLAELEKQKQSMPPDEYCFLYVLKTQCHLQLSEAPQALVSFMTAEKRRSEAGVEVRKQMDNLAPIIKDIKKQLNDIKKQLGMR